MRLLTYILVGAGAAIAVIALAVVLLDDGEQQTVAPQAETGQQAVVTAKSEEADDTSATRRSDGAGGHGGEAVSQPEADGSRTGAGAPQPSSVEIDLAQVRPDGNAVFAGKASPHSRITVFEGEIILGTTTADPSGEWVVVPDKALGPGEHLVSVGAESDDGTSALAEVTLAIRVGEKSDEQPLVALLPQTEKDIPQLLQSPDDDKVTASQVVVSDGDVAQVQGAETASAPSDAAPAVSAGPAIAPRSLSWKAGGELIVSGVSRGGTSVVVTSDNALFGKAVIGPQGDWQVAGRVDLDRAQRVMRFALDDAEGNRVATYDLPVATRDLSQGLDGSRMVVVQQGDALWRIAYRTYGEGVKYVDIVRRNAAAIDDPDLIYPNQIFAIPN
ncbi:MAG: LysM peptidoglycan-binding domain-containing protein [Candidatus Puniceispirillaceae bacterium]